MEQGRGMDQPEPDPIIPIEQIIRGELAHRIAQGMGENFEKALLIETVGRLLPYIGLALFSTLGLAIYYTTKFTVDDVWAATVLAYLAGLAWYLCALCGVAFVSSIPDKQARAKREKLVRPDATDRRGGLSRLLAEGHGRVGKLKARATLFADFGKGPRYIGRPELGCSLGWWVIRCTGATQGLLFIRGLLDADPDLPAGCTLIASGREAFGATTDHAEPAAMPKTMPEALRRIEELRGLCDIYKAAAESAARAKVRTRWRTRP